MNVSVTANKLIDRAILLKEGGAITIACPSYIEMERLRIRLYKLRKQLEKSHKELAYSLDITRKATANRWTIYITKDNSLSGVFIIEDGVAKPFDDEIEEVEKTEEIEEETKEVEGFDEVAAKIEAAQGLTQGEKEVNNENNSL